MKKTQRNIFRKKTGRGSSKSTSQAIQIFSLLRDKKLISEDELIKYISFLNKGEK